MSHPLLRNAARPLGLPWWSCQPSTMLATALPKDTTARANRS
jgi:hypothetical protein